MRLDALSWFRKKLGERQFGRGACARRAFRIGNELVKDFQGACSIAERRVDQTGANWNQLFLPWLLQLEGFRQAARFTRLFAPSTR